MSNQKKILDIVKKEKIIKDLEKNKYRTKKMERI